MEVVAEAGDAGTARRRTSGLKPGVLVLDLNMPGEPSLASIPATLEGSPGTAVVVLTMQDDPAFAREAFRLGPRRRRQARGRLGARGRHSGRRSRRHLHQPDPGRAPGVRSPRGRLAA